MDDLLKEMGKRIHDRRKQLHMTQERLAELELTTERQRVQELLKQQTKNTPCAPV